MLRKLLELSLITLPLFALLGCEKTSSEKNNLETSEVNYNIFEAIIGDETKQYVSFLPLEFVFEHGLTPKAILGEINSTEEKEINYDTDFVENPLFKETIFAFCRTVLKVEPSFVDSARIQKDGWIYVIDQRTPTPNGEVPPYDIIGAFEVINSSLGEFRPNENYSIITQNGFINFGEDLNVNWINFLKDVVIKQSIEVGTPVT